MRNLGFIRRGFNNPRFPSQAFIGEIDKKQPEIDQTADEVGRLCADGALDEEDSILLRNKLQKVSTNWEELRREAQEKQMRYMS